MTAARTVAGLPEDQVCAVLSGGVVEIRGRILEASNATLLARVTLDGITLPCVYKPVRGERPLWDFPAETLARREVAAFELSRWSGLHVVPPTVFRDGPLGEGSLQVWIGAGEQDEEGDPVPVDGGAGLVDLFRPARVPGGWLKVLTGEDGAGRAVVLAHADDERLRAMAVFDLIANNADRKAGHILRDCGGVVLGVDHGLTFHEEHKLRTVLWGFADRPLGPDLLAAAEKVALELTPSQPLHATLRQLLAEDEIELATRRARRLFRLGVLPGPREGYPTVPWPLF